MEEEIYCDLAPETTANPVPELTFDQIPNLKFIFELDGDNKVNFILRTNDYYHEFQADTYSTIQCTFEDQAELSIFCDMVETFILHCYNSNVKIEKIISRLALSIDDFNRENCKGENYIPFSNHIRQLRFILWRAHHILTMQ